MQCRDFREIANSYLSDELLIETNHDVIRHLESCANCRSELAARRELRSKLWEAFQQARELQIRDEFTNNLKTQLREAALRRAGSSWGRRAANIAIAASLVIVAALGFRALQHRWRSQNPPSITANTGRDGQSDKQGKPALSSDGRSAMLNALLTESAVGDHRNCALSHRLDEKPIDLDEAGRRYDRAYFNLVSAVVSEGTLPAGAKLVEAHSCVFKGRPFGHVILKYHNQLVSVLVTNFEAQDQSAPSATAVELIGSGQAARYQLAHFETSRHSVFVVSSLSDTENLAIARAIAPSVSRHIQRAEGVA